MTYVTKAHKRAQHCLASRPITPLSDLTQTSEFGRVALRRAVGISAAGVVFGASFAGSVASAAPSPTPEATPDTTRDEFASALADDTTGVIVSIDQDWEPGDDVAAVATEATVEEEEEVVEEAASRDYSREDLGGSYDAIPESSVDTSSIANMALSVTGIPYVYGGSSLSGMDCSGLVVYVYAQFGISLPHSSGAIGAMGTNIPMSELQPGDIIAYSGHVAIYVGGGQMVEAIDYGQLSAVSSVRGGGWGVRI